MVLVVKALALGVALALTAPAFAQMDQPACARVSDRNLPADLDGWNKPALRVMAGSRGSSAVPTVALARRATVILQPAAAVSFVVPPEQVRAAEASHAGLLAFRVPQAGTYRVSASKPVWIDVLDGDKALKPAAFGRLAPCTSIRKVLEFDLAPGRYTVQISGNAGPNVELMISLKP